MAASSITAEDFLLLSSDLAIMASVDILAGGFCYGIFFVLNIIALHILDKRPKPHTHPTKVLRWAIMFLFFAFTMTMALQAGGYILRSRWPRYGSSETPLMDRWNMNVSVYSKIYKAMSLSQPVPYMAADAVPIWRAYTLWAHSRNARLLLVIACGLNMLVGLTRIILEPLMYSIDYLKDYEYYLYPIQLGFSTITNALVTIAIGIRAWHHRNLTKDIRRSSSSPVYVLVILVEAGAALFLTQTLNLTMTILMGNGYHNSLTHAAVVLTVIGDTVAASYPTLIVIVLSFRGSMLDEGATNVVEGMSFDVERVVGPNMQEERQLTIARFEPGEPMEQRDASGGEALREDAWEKNGSRPEIR
ncbi:hypothetical protein DL96DRAFT_1683337 [Flagelloscypha sp. PMI_526]|nr:hypothetical protein DL96DRAFT_1683337 [Flagelloscypha sp. PMI_526]